MEENIGREEIERVIKNLKECKAPGEDGLGIKIWKKGGEVVNEWLWDVCSRVWKGGGFPREWREGVIVPILKTGRGEKVEEYRGVTLTQTAYKVYAAVLMERLRREVRGKGYYHRVRQDSGEGWVR